MNLPSAKCAGLLPILVPKYFPEGIDRARLTSYARLALQMVFSEVHLVSGFPTHFQEDQTVGAFHARTSRRDAECIQSRQPILGSGNISGFNTNAIKGTDLLISA